MPLRPDIFLLLTDQQSTWTVGGYAARSHETAHEEHGTPTLKTPSIDSLAGRGVLLTSFVVGAAWCVRREDRCSPAVFLRIMVLASSVLGWLQAPQR